jgi:hypothetical protein
MRPSPFRRGTNPDPVRQDLVEVRRGLLRLHKALIDSERKVYERGHGQMSNGQFLQALIQEPFFAWLRPYSGLIVEIDEVLATREPVAEAEARAFVERVRALVLLPREGGGAEERYEMVRQRDPSVLLLHVELTSRISTALGER